MHVEVLGRGRRAGWLSPAREFSPDEREAFGRLLRGTYSRFVARVATGRHLTRERVLATAEGKLMTAARGRTTGLVNRRGGLRTAVARARAARTSAPMSPSRSGRRGEAGSTSSRACSAAAAVAATTRARRSAPSRSLVTGSDLVTRASGTLALLLGRERTVTALPYVLEVR